MGVKHFDVMNLGKTGLIDPEQLGYQDSVEIIKDESLKVQKSFVKIGWYLKHIRDNELYKEDGYNSIWECAADQLGYSQSTASRFISICEKFSKNHNSPELDAKYAGFDKSQMIEMLPMETEQLEKVTPNMTVKEIRDIKIKNKAPEPQEDKKTNDDIPGQTSIEKDFPEHLPDEQPLVQDEVETESYATSHRENDLCPPSASSCIRQEWGTYREVRETEAAEETIATSQSSDSDKEEPHDKIIRQENRYCREAPMGNPFSCTTMNVLENLRAEMGDKCQFINLDTAYHTQGSNEPDPCCKDCDNGSCGYRCRRSINKVNTEIVDSDPMPKDGLAAKKYILEQEKKTLNDMLKFNDLPEMTVLKQKTIVAALAAMVCDLEAAESATEPEPQPEFPILKNNDQRKQWLEDYKMWGLWYRDEHIDVNYYKYDFSDGSRLVVAEYPQRYGYWNDERSDEHYYHLLEKNKKSYKKTYDEQYRNRINSETELVEFLKSLQKRGW